MTGRAGRGFVPDGVERFVVRQLFVVVLVGRQVPDGLLGRGWLAGGPVELSQQGLDRVKVRLRLLVVVGWRLAERNIDVRLGDGGGWRRTTSGHPEYGADGVSAVRLRV